ncbi:hypothetical protein DO97_16735 [Neosynechococcus sphagnicola sy1]|uniref:DUF1092 domain-containing protein n=2 Tax=Neosynechococcus TaxID=1501143 RepID=A0A098TMV1_9CYAN|nr:hypothetical protein DO97_16735 [Neosynechococcus sphagnicola sy1]
MTIWQADFYRRPLQDESGQPLWELLICDQTRSLTFSALCPQANANAEWLALQLQQAIATTQHKPDSLQVFRPQSLTLLTTACQELGFAVVPKRKLPALQEWLRECAQAYPHLPNYNHQPYDPLEIPKLPPLPLSEQLWGERWRFANLPAGELAIAFGERPIPVLHMPEELLPLRLGLASHVAIPGVVIDGGRQSMRLARWLQSVEPVTLNYSPGAPDGLILEAGLADRWVISTFTDSEVEAAAQLYATRCRLAQGLHFLLVQPDDSGITYSGFWLLQQSASN